MSQSPTESTYSKLNKAHVVPLHPTEHGSEEVATEVDNNSSEPLAETTTNTHEDRNQPNAEGDSEKFEGDWALANSILLVRDGIWWLEFCRAVSIGDTGRVWEVLKVWNRNQSQRRRLTWI